MPLGKGTMRLVDFPTKDFEKISVTGSPVGFTAAKITSSSNAIAVAAFLTVETANIRFRTDGSDPDATTGHQLFVGNNLLITDRQALVDFRAIRSGSSSAVIQVTYY